MIWRERAAAGRSSDVRDLLRTVGVDRPFDAQNWEPTGGVGRRYFVSRRPDSAKSLSVQAVLRCLFCGCLVALAGSRQSLAISSSLSPGPPQGQRSLYTGSACRSPHLRRLSPASLQETVPSRAKKIQPRSAQARDVLPFSGRIANLRHSGNNTLKHHGEADVLMSGVATYLGFGRARAPRRRIHDAKLFEKTHPNVAVESGRAIGAALRVWGAMLNELGGWLEPLRGHIGAVLMS